jgi:hypothetical protein
MEQQAVAMETAQSDVTGRFQDAEVAKFTFGTPTSVTRNGFVKVMVNDSFTPEKGYGFEFANGLSA